MPQNPTTIYLDEEQRKKLFKLAEVRNSSFSSEIRAAIDRYVEDEALSVSEDEARMLVDQASESIERMLDKLDEAHNTVQRILRQSNTKRKRK